MKIIANEKLIQRNSRIGQLATVSSLVVLGGGFYMSLTSRDPNMVGLMWGALLIGFILSQVGIYFGNRWGRRPRPDEAVDDALKSFDNRTTIFHYTLPVAHVLVGPVGIWLLDVRTQMGTISYEKDRWRQKGGGFVQKYLRIFAQEGIGRPDVELPLEVDKFKKHLQQVLPDTEIPPVRAALVFIHQRAVLDDVEGAPYPTLTAKDLKEFLRKNTKGSALPMNQVKLIAEALGASPDKSEPEPEADD